MPIPTKDKVQRILVVDDEPSISELISTSLRFVGFDVRTAANGAQALSMAEEFKPHAMVLDTKKIKREFLSASSAQILHASALAKKLAGLVYLSSTL